MNDREFLCEMLTADDAVAAVRGEIDRLIKIIPEIADMIGFEHRHPHHHLDVWEHTLLALSHAEGNLKMRVALLLHDVGKPRVAKERDGVRHYKGHQTESAKIAKTRLGELGFDEDFIGDVCEMINRHDLPLTIPYISENPRLAREIFKVQKCDILAHNPEFNQKRLDYIEMCEKIYRFG